MFRTAGNAYWGLPKHKQVKNKLFCNHFAVWWGDPKRIPTPQPIKPGNPQNRSISRKSLGYHGNPKDFKEILRIWRISNDVEQSSGTLCKSVGRSNVFACASTSLRNVFRVLRTDNNNIYLFSYIYVVRTGLSEKSSTLLQTIGTWKSYKSVNSNRVGWFRTCLWPANLHSVPFTECVLASLTGVLRSDRRILFVSKCVFQRAGPNRLASSWCLGYTND